MNTYLQYETNAVSPTVVGREPWSEDKEKGLSTFL